MPWKIAGIVGGVALGFVATRYAGPQFSEPMPGLIAGFIGGRVLSDITDRFFVR